MSDLKVDYQLLDSIERSLTSLSSEFSNIKAQTSGYDGAMGSGDVASAMDGFAGNWNDHRKDLLSSIQTLGKMVSETRQQFQRADNKLKSSLTEKPHS
jgi:hypothetical protein